MRAVRTPRIGSDDVNVASVASFWRKRDARRIGLFARFQRALLSLSLGARVAGAARSSRLCGLRGFNLSYNIRSWKRVGLRCVQICPDMAV